jgi:hypothetical protein
MSLGTTPEILVCIKKAEELSLKTCEVCGNHGHIIDSSWVKVKYEDCEKSSVRVF